MSVYTSVDERVYLSMLFVCVFQVKLAFVFLRAYVRADAVNLCLCLCKCYFFVFVFICACVTARVSFVLN